MVGQFFCIRLEQILVTSISSVSTLFHLFYSSATDYLQLSLFPGLLHLLHSSRSVLFTVVSF